MYDRILKQMREKIRTRQYVMTIHAEYAATAPDVQGGDYYGPDGWQGLRGYPTKVRSSGRSYDPAVSAKLWTVSEKLTGVRYL